MKPFPLMGCLIEPLPASDLESGVMALERPRTLGELKTSGYRWESVKDEMRREPDREAPPGEPLFPDILGYEETVLPQIQNAILSRHDMLFLGLRGQAKTRMLRQLVHLLDDALPDRRRLGDQRPPLSPISRIGPRPDRRAGRRHARSPGSAASGATTRSLRLPT